MWTALARETDDPSLRAALVGEERAGLRFALFVRAGALAAIAVWLLFSVPMPRVFYWLGLAALFLLSGAVPYLMRRRPYWRLWFAAFAAVDAAVSGSRPASGPSTRRWGSSPRFVAPTASTSPTCRSRSASSATSHSPAAAPDRRSWGRVPTATVPASTRP